MLIKCYVIRPIKSRISKPGCHCDIAYPAWPLRCSVTIISSILAMIYNMK
jgi:hypothetical protein